MRNPFAAAVQRMAPRAAAEVYAGASSSRTLEDFIMGTLSADTALRGALQVLRNRARELTINNSTATAIPQIFSENVIGEDGILYQATVTRPDGSYDEAVNQQLEAAWYRWCEPKYASVDRQMSWEDIQTLIVESEVTDGEVILRLVPGFKNPFGFAVEVIDPDQLDHTYWRSASPGQNEIRMGVEVDVWGAPVAYHLWSNHPSEARRRVRTRVPADQILHFYLKRRPRQTRGVTWFAPMIVDVQMHGGYRMAELMAARVAAAKQGFFELDENADAPEATESEDGKPYIPLEGSPGSFELLPKGLKFKPWDPQHPNAGFAQFDQAILRSLAAGFRISYMAVSADLTKTSFSSGRIGADAERAVYRKLQKRFVTRVAKPVHRAWARMAMLSGALQLPTYETERYLAASWHPRVFTYVDPEKDLNYRLAEVGAGVNSLTRIAAERGRDLVEVLQERKREIELAATLGVPITLGTGAAPQPATVQDETEREAHEEGEDETDETEQATSRRGHVARQAPPMRLLRRGAS